MTAVKGFDSRYWDGVLQPYYQDKMKFVGIKISQGQNWTPKEGYPLLVRQWLRANKNYGLLRLPFHFWLPSLPWYNHKDYGEKQAENFFTRIEHQFEEEFGELPPAIDAESRFTGMCSGKDRVTCLRACLDRTAELWNVSPMIYTATWYWDTYIAPYTGDWKYWLDHDLWEADPPPDTDIQGWGKTNSIHQVKLDQAVVGFNAKVDFNTTTQAWIDSRTFVEPIPDDCESIVNIALANQKLQLEGDHLVEIAVAEKVAYNAAITDGGQAIGNLKKE